MELDYPGFPERLRLVLETGFSFVLNGAVTGIICSEYSSLGVTTNIFDRQQAFTLSVILRGILGLLINIYLGFFEFFFDPAVLTDWMLHYDQLPETIWLLLGAVRSIAFFVANSLASHYKSTWTWPLLVLFRHPPFLVYAIYASFVLLALHSIRPEMKVISSRWTLAKILAMLAVYFVEIRIWDKRIGLAKSILTFSKASDQSRPHSDGDYLYTPILYSRTIRLLKMETTAKGVCCTLETVQIDEAPPYWALSYLWGTDQMDMCFIELDTPAGPRFLSITSNCADAIRYLVPFKSRYLWIDAICINQQDILEKTHQLPLMPDIYSRATLVIGYLGASNFFPVGDYLRRLMQIVGDGEKTILSPFDTSLPRMHETLFNALAQVYWGRAWIFQELILSKSLILVYGTASFQWKHITFVAKHTISGDISTFPDSPFRHRGNNKLPETALRAYLALSNFGIFSKKIEELKTLCESSEVSKRPTLAQVIDMAFPREATDPRDAVYAMLSLCADASVEALQPNYDPSVSCEQVYTNVSMHYLLAGNRINLLLLAGLAYREPIARLPSYMYHTSGFLPSWVPDLALQTGKRLGSWAADQERRRECQLECRVCPARRVLSVRGRLIDKILGVSKLDIRGSIRPLTNEFDMSQVMQPFLDMYDVSLQMARSHVPDPYPTGITREEAHWRAFIMDHDDGGSPAAAKTKQVLAAFQCLREGREPNHDAFEHENASDAKPIEGWGSLISSYAFAVTAAGYMAWVPPGSLEGDVLCVLEGCIVPFVLRQQSEDTFALWGDGYVQGFMHGETEALDTRWFRIVWSTRCKTNLYY